MSRWPATLEAAQRALERWTRLPERQPVSLWLIAAILGVATGNWLFTHQALPWTLWAGDSLEYALVGRRLAWGEGFTTSVLFPLELAHGVDAQHPSLLRAPLWSLVLALAFAVLGPHAWVAQATAGLCYLVAVGLATALAMTLAGRVAGAFAGVAIALSPQLVLFSVDGLSEPLFACWVALSFLLCVRGAHPGWVGAVCGLAYLTRYNGAVLVPAIALLLLQRPRPLQTLAWFAACVGLVALPWWLRNWVVLGNPFSSLYRYALFVTLETRGANSSLYYMLEPDLASHAAMHPLAKLRVLLPKLIVHWPLASANLVACAGFLLGCAKRDRVALAFALVAVATTLIVALVFPVGRYFVPYLPVCIAVGAAAWWWYGGRLRLPALVLLALAPLLPPVPSELDDVRFHRAVFRMARLGETAAAASYPLGASPAAPCLKGRPLVVAQDAARISWETDAIAIHMPASAADFWRIVREHPVAFVQMQRFERVSRDALTREFEPLPECGADLFARRAAAPRTR